jgi:hypothetical protein
MRILGDDAGGFGSSAPPPHVGVWSGAPRWELAWGSESRRSRESKAVTPVAGRPVLWKTP